MRGTPGRDGPCERWGIFGQASEQTPRGTRVVVQVVPTACPIGLSSGMYVHRVSAGRVGVRLGYMGVGGVGAFRTWIKESV